MLDEPSVGLHARDIDRLTGILRHLVSQGNTVVVVEHDESIMRAADTLIEIGPPPRKERGQRCRPRLLRGTFGASLFHHRSLPFRAANDPSAREDASRKSARTQQKQPLLASRRTRHKAQPPRPQRQHPAGPIRCAQRRERLGGNPPSSTTSSTRGSSANRANRRTTRAYRPHRERYGLWRDRPRRSVTRHAHSTAPTLRSTWMHGTRSAASSRALPKPKRQV